MDNNIYDFGDRLKALRLKNKLTQTEVAKRLNLNRVTIGNYEKNNITPSVDVLINLAILYRTSTDYILNLDKRMTINLEGLTEKQQISLEKIMDIIISELKSEK